MKHLLVIPLACLLLLLSGCQSQQSPKSRQAAPSNVASSAVGATERYTDDKYGISFAYPAGWTVLKNATAQGLTVHFTSPEAAKQGTNMPRITLVAVSGIDDATTSLDAIEQAIISPVAKTLPQFSVTGTSDTTVGGASAREIRFSAADFSGNPTEGIFVLFHAHGKVYALSLNALLKDFESAQEQFGQTLVTLQLE